jgi:hypothetical protein
MILGRLDCPIEIALVAFLSFVVQMVEVCYAKRRDFINIHHWKLGLCSRHIIAANYGHRT